tara:strand:+ start:1541 stop:1909 length:369 start_codon:yes stop_codon:yes gene_type:complete
VTIATTMGRMLSNAYTLRDRTYASWIAQNKIIELRTTGEFPKLGETSGEIEYANNEWAWRAVVAETGIENLLRVDVDIMRPGDENTIKSVTGFIGEPIQPGSANGIILRGFSGSNNAPGVVQ